MVHWWHALNRVGCGKFYKERLAQCNSITSHILPISDEIRQWVGRQYEAEAYLGRNDLFYLLTRLLRRPDLDNDWLYDRCREVEAQPDGMLDLWAREHYKMERLDEPTPTPEGWKLHGDLIVGDQIFGADGSVIHVIALNEIITDAPAYEIEFDDGTTIEAGAQHLWEVERHTRKRVFWTWKADGVGKRVYRESALMRTEEIAAWPHKKDKRLAIPVARPLHLPDAALPIEPYLLGCWLGDGTSVAGDITCGDSELFENIAARGNRVCADRTPHRNAALRRIVGLYANLRKTGLLGNKHIPAVYLRASIGQRLELLRGLMDTDGHCNTRGTATFVNINSTLVDGVFELCQTLGLKPTRMQFNGKYKEAPYPFFQVSFQAYATMAPFSLKRKVERCKLGCRSHPRRYIVACRPVEPSPMRCIQVDAADGMYLTGRSMVPTHNSTIITFGKTIQDIMIDPEVTVGIFSHVRPIAKGFLQQIKREFESNEILKAIYSDVLWADPEKQSPKWSEDQGLIVKRKSNPKEATVEASGLVDGQPTGKHYRLRVYDDIISREAVTSAEMIKKVTDAWDLSQNLGVAGGAARYIGTRYNLADTYSVIMSRGAAVPRLHPATHNGRLDGVPVFFTQEQWERRKRESSREILAAQMLQNPLADEAASFRPEWLKAYEIRPRTLNVYIMADPSMGRSATSDRTAIAVVGLASNGGKFLLDGFCHRMSLSQRWRALRRVYEKWSRARGVMTVRVGYERYGMQSDLEYFQEQMQISRRTQGANAISFAIDELNWPRDGGNSKRERVERLEPDFRNGRFFLPLQVMLGGKIHRWKLQDDPDVRGYGELTYILMGGPTSAMMAALQGGSPELIAKPIRQIDEDGHLYDLTDVFLKEYKDFPAGAHDDLLDSVSRLYDMEPVRPVVISAGDTEPREYWDR